MRLQGLSVSDSGPATLGRHLRADVLLNAERRAFAHCRFRPFAQNHLQLAKVRVRVLYDSLTKVDEVYTPIPSGVPQYAVVQISG